MATSESTGSSKKMEELKTLNDMVTKSKQHPDKLIAVLVNVQYPERGTIEHKLAWWRYSFEKENNVLFCKYIWFKEEEESNKQQLGVNRTPSFLFFHRGERVGDLNNLNETAKPGEDTADEKKIKQEIKKLYNKLSASEQKLDT